MRPTTRPQSRLHGKTKGGSLDKTFQTVDEGRFDDGIPERQPNLLDYHELIVEELQRRRIERAKWAKAKAKAQPKSDIAEEAGEG